MRNPSEPSSGDALPPDRDVNKPAASYTSTTGITLPPKYVVVSAVKYLPRGVVLSNARQRRGRYLATLPGIRSWR